MRIIELASFLCLITNHFTISNGQMLTQYSFVTLFSAYRALLFCTLVSNKCAVWRGLISRVEFINKKNNVRKIDTNV
jgi:hypothetical protein